MKEYNNKEKDKDESMEDYTQKKHTSECTSDEEKKVNTEEGNRSNGQNVEIKLNLIRRTKFSLSLTVPVYIVMPIIFRVLSICLSLTLVGYINKPLYKMTFLYSTSTSWTNIGLTRIF